jgi:hypothetical protein
MKNVQYAMYAMAITSAIVFAIGWITEDRYQVPETYESRCVLPEGQKD